MESQMNAAGFEMSRLAGACLNCTTSACFAEQKRIPKFKYQQGIYDHKAERGSTGTGGERIEAGEDKRKRGATRCRGTTSRRDH